MRTIRELVHIAQHKDHYDLILPRTRSREKHATYRDHSVELTTRYGRHEEDKFRMAMERKPRVGKARSIHFTLHGGRKVRSCSRKCHAADSR